jgi:hypothetical protein
MLVELVVVQRAYRGGPDGSETRQPERNPFTFRNPRVFLEGREKLPGDKIAELGI